jgi:hypothetical protein
MRKSGTGTSYNSSDNVAGLVRDIDVGIDGSLYAISNTLVARKGYTLHKLDHSTNLWQELSGTPPNVKSIATDMIGRIWVADVNGRLFSHEGKSDWIE